MLKVIKRRVTLIIALCILVCVAISQPLLSLADSLSEPDTSIKITDVDKELLEKDAETAAVKSDANISVDLLDKTLTTTSVIDLKTQTEVLKYLVNQKLTGSLESYIPSSVDNSQTKYFPKIMDQGRLNSCTTWSTVYYQMSYAVNRELNRDGKKEENTFSPTWIYAMVNEGENKGNFYADILKILTEIGAVPMTKVPAVTTDEGDNVRNVIADKDLWLEASKYRVAEYYSIDLKKDSVDTLVTEPKDKDLDAMKKALALGEVLTATTYSYKWNKEKIQTNGKVSENKKYAGQNIVVETTGEQKGAHRITIVGYNDNIWVDINENGIVEEGEKGAFKIANSYGTNSDNDGFVWMSYDAINNKSCLDAANAQKDPNRSPGLFDIIGFNIDLDEKDDECYAALAVKTQDLKSINVKITATNKEGKDVSYEPAPFTNAMIRGMGAYPFNSSENGDRGTFFIDLANVVEGLTKDKIDDYIWKFEISDTSEEKELTVESLQIYTKSTNSYTQSYVEEPITVNYDTINIKIERELTGILELAKFF